MPPSPLLVEAITVVVLLIWIATSVRAIALHDYEGLQIVTPVVMVVVGALFGSTVLRRKNGEKP